MKKRILLILLLIIIILSLLIYIIYIVYQSNYNNHQEQNEDIISTYNNPIVPHGFHTINTQTAQWTKLNDGTIDDWNKGLVIEDEKGNQFVWVPINQQKISYEIDGIEDEFKYNPNLLNLSNNEEKQILKYGGFYISRYEAGVPFEMESHLSNITSDTNDINGVPVSQKGVIPWNYISLRNAKLNAESMYNNNEYSSHLPTLKQMMYISNWLNSSNYDVYDSSKFGNYSNVNFEFSGFYSDDYGSNYKVANSKMKSEKNMILSTGATDRNMTNNIYDLAGNLWEYTDTYCSINENEILGYYCVGGHYDNTGYNYPVFNHSLKNVVPLDKVGFRIVLSFKN